MSNLSFVQSSNSFSKSPWSRIRYQGAVAPQDWNRQTETWHVSQIDESDVWSTRRQLDPASAAGGCQGTAGEGLGTGGGSKLTARSHHSLCGNERSQQNCCHVFLHWATMPGPGGPIASWRWEPITELYWTTKTIVMARSGGPLRSMQQLSMT